MSGNFRIKIHKIFSTIFKNTLKSPPDAKITIMPWVKLQSVFVLLKKERKFTIFIYYINKVAICSLGQPE